MSEEEKSTWIERILLVVLRRTLGNVTKAANRFVRKAIRLVAMALAGTVIAVLGVAFLAVGVVKWFSFLMPNWLAWTIVGVILMLAGTLVAVLGSRS